MSRFPFSLRLASTWSLFLIIQQWTMISGQKSHLWLLCAQNYICTLKPSCSNRNISLQRVCLLSDDLQSPSASGEPWSPWNLRSVTRSEKHSERPGEDVAVSSLWVRTSPMLVLFRLSRFAQLTLPLDSGVRDEPSCPQSAFINVINIHNLCPFIDTTSPNIIKRGATTLYRSFNYTDSSRAINVQTSLNAAHLFKWHQIQQL